MPLDGDDGYSPKRSIRSRMSPLGTNPLNGGTRVPIELPRSSIISSWNCAFATLGRHDFDDLRGGVRQQFIVGIEEHHDLAAASFESRIER